MKLIHDECENVIPSIDNVSLIIADIPWDREYDYKRLFDLFKFNISLVILVDNTLDAFLKYMSFASTRWGWFYRGLWLHDENFTDTLGFANPGEPRAQKKASILHFENKRETDFPEERPVELMEYIIGNFSLGGLVLDPFMGSGASAVAAKKLGNDYIGIEKNKEVYEKARERIYG
jgi:DNA modification methylase